MEKPTVIIPARMWSTRFPGRPLFEVEGKPLVLKMWEEWTAAGYATYVASGDREILQAIPYKCAMYVPQANNGTERCAKAALQIGGEIGKPLKWVANVQCEFETLSPLPKLEQELPFPVCTYHTYLDNADGPDTVRVLTNSTRLATWFTREPAGGYAHLGIYVMRGDLLQLYFHTP